MSDIDIMREAREAAEAEAKAKREELRDRFAMAALTGILADPGVYLTADTARRAYEMADLMLAARAKGAR